MNQQGDNQQQSPTSGELSVGAVPQPEMASAATGSTSDASLPSAGEQSTEQPTVALSPCATKSPAPDHDSEGGWMASLQSLTVTVVIAVFVITFIVQAFQIPSESMENTLLIGDYLLVDKAHYGPGSSLNRLMPYQPLHRGDIIVFRYPIHPSQHFVKRVIGLPGDHLRMVRGRVFINGQPLEEPYARQKFRTFDSFRDNFPTGQYLSPSVEARWYIQMQKLTEDGQLIVPQDNFFVLGDNRDDSLDSRYWGFVPRENIIGRPLLIYWSVGSREEEDQLKSPDGKLARFGQAAIALFHDLRWNRMLRLVH